MLRQGVISFNRHIDLSFLRIDNTGASHIAELIMGNQSLRKIELRDCKISREGIAVIKEALVKNNPCERHIDLAGNVDSKMHDMQMYQATLASSGRSPLVSLSLLAKKAGTTPTVESDNVVRNTCYVM